MYLLGLMYWMCFSVLVTLNLDVTCFQMRGGRKESGRKTIQEMMTAKKRTNGFMDQRRSYNLEKVKVKKNTKEETFLFIYLF